jgi:hypothetical protein
MERAAIQEQDIEGRRKRGGYLLQKGLKTPGVHMREGKKEMVPGQRFNPPIEIQGLILLLKGGNGFDAFAGNQATENRHEAKPAFILGKDFDGELTGVGLLSRRQLDRKVVFLNVVTAAASCLQLLLRGTFGAAWSLVWTV